MKQKFSTYETDIDIYHLKTLIMEALFEAKTEESEQMNSG